MRLDGANSRVQLVHLGDATVGNCGYAQAQCSTSIGQSGEIWKEKTQENDSH